MSAPRIVVRYFGDGHQSQWGRLVRVLAYTARVHAPGWTQDIAAVQPDRTMSSPFGKQGDVWNTQKLDLWTAIVEAAADGERLLLLDADTALTRSIDAIWEGPDFDVAYTIKPKGSRFPLNGGVVFLRVSDRTRAFMRAWRDKNRFFLEQPLEYQVWRAPYGGINQTALGVLLRERPTEWTLERLRCLEWNCEDEHWATFDPHVTRIVHVKSGLRQAVFKEARVPDGATPLDRLWHQLEKEAMRSDAQGGRVVRPHELEDTMVRPETLETPTVPPLSRRQRRRAQQTQGGHDGHA